MHFFNNVFISQWLHLEVGVKSMTKDHYIYKHNNSKHFCSVSSQSMADLSVRKYVKQTNKKTTYIKIQKGLNLANIPG